MAVEEAEVTTAVEKRKKMIMTDKILRGDCFFFCVNFGPDFLLP